LKKQTIANVLLSENILEISFEKNISYIQFISVKFKFDSIVEIHNNYIIFSNSNCYYIYFNIFINNIFITELYFHENYLQIYKNYDIIFQPDFLYLIYNEINIYNNQLLLKKYNLISKKYIVIGGNSNYYRDDRPQYDAVTVYVNMINNIKTNTKHDIVLYAASGEEIKWLSTIASKTNVKLISVSIVNWQDAFVILSNAYLSISGRYHPSIMSIIGKVPSLLISANHCKMNGVNEMFFKGQKVIDSHDIHNNYNYIIDFIKKYENNELYNTTVDAINNNLNAYLDIINNIKFN
jgi:polysaccharide pyruvyl transferase WcaK-like protein